MKRFVKKIKSNLFSTMRKAGLSPMKEVLFVIAVDLLFLGMGFYVLFSLHQILPLLGFALLCFLSDFFLLGKAKRLLHAEDKEMENEFVRIFAYFSIFVKDGFPTYSALENTIRYASPVMEKRLRDLLLFVDKDKTVVPFVKFADDFPSLEIRQVMISIFKMSENGGEEAYLRQFGFLFDSLQQEKKKERLERINSQFGSLCALPLIDSAISMILITVGIVVAIGGLIYGI